MPQRSDMLPQGLAGIWQAIKDLRRDLQEIRAARRLEAASIGAGGLQVLDGGYFRVFDTDGSPQFFVGGISPAHPDGSPQRGLLVYREDGTLALSLFSADSNPQGLAIRDKGGVVVFADDVLTGGLARPYISTDAWFGATETPAFTTSSGSFVTLQNLPWAKQHPRVTGHFLVKADPGVAGEIRLVDDSGAVIAGPISVSAGAYTYGGATGPLAGPLYSFTYLHWQARVTSGAGSIGVKGLSTFGVQS